MLKKINLILIPFAGGSKYSFAELEKYSRTELNFIPLEYPGRGGRISEPLLKDLELIVKDLFNQIKSHLNKPYAIFGHSMGAMVGFLMLGLIKRHNLPMPRCIFVSGKAGPMIVNKDKTYLLPKQDFWKKISDYGGCSPEVLNDVHLLDLFEPILRADIEALEEYKFVSSDDLYDIPVVAMIGSRDYVTVDEALSWQQITKRPIALHQFEGDHFFLFKNSQKISDIVTQALI